MQLPKCGSEVFFYADDSAGPDAPWVVLCHDSLEIKGKKKKAPSNEPFSAAYMAAAIGPALTARGCRWIAPSLPGYGGSTGKRCGMKVVDLMKKEAVSGPSIIVEAMDYIGAPRALFVGINSGALVAGSVAARFASRTSGFVLSVGNGVAQYGDLVVEHVFAGFFCFQEPKAPETKFFGKLKKRKNKHVLCVCAKGKFPDKKRKGYLAKQAVAVSTNIGLKGKLTDMFGWSEQQFVEQLAKLAKSP